MHGSIKFQILKEMDKLQRFGQSKHKAKQEEKERSEREGVVWNPSKVDGIFSIKTYDAYKDLNIKYGEWAKETHGVKNIQGLNNKQYVKEYLEYRQQAGDSPYSLRLRGSAISKLFGCSSTDFGFDYPARNRENITRSRLDRFHDTEFSEMKHQDIINFGKGTGLRRTEISLLRPEQVQKLDDGQLIININKHEFGPQSKGGRDRITHVLENQKENVWNMAQKAIQENRKTVFEHIPNRLDEHALRREYAQSRYDEITQQYKNKSVDIKTDYHTKDNTHRSYDRSILMQVSNDLGHGRINIVVQHYLDK